MLLVGSSRIMGGMKAIRNVKLALVVCSQFPARKRAIRIFCIPVKCLNIYLRNV